MNEACAALMVTLDSLCPGLCLHARVSLGSNAGCNETSTPTPKAARTEIQNGGLVKSWSSSVYCPRGMLRCLQPTRWRYNTAEWMPLRPGTSSAGQTGCYNDLGLYNSTRHPSYEMRLLLPLMPVPAVYYPRAQSTAMRPLLHKRVVIHEQTAHRTVACDGTPSRGCGFEKKGDG